MLARLVALVALSCSAIAAAAQTVPDASSQSEAALEASIGGKVRQLAVLTRNINRWGCDREMYATSVEGCRQLNAEAHRLATELQELKAEAGDRWTSEKQAAAESSVPQAPPARPKPYTYRARTNPTMIYRTLGVRLCDGFYYPLSEASQPQGFLADEQRCQSSCSSPRKLFYSLNPDDDSEQMVALTGERYAELPNAFRYRTEYVDACACKTKPWSAEAKAEYRGAPSLPRERKASASLPPAPERWRRSWRTRTPGSRKGLVRGMPGSSSASPASTGRSSGRAIVSLALGVACSPRRFRPPTSRRSIASSCSAIGSRPSPA